MCPRGARLLAGRGGWLERTKVVAHCLLIEAGGEHVLVDTGFGTADCADRRRLGMRFNALVNPACDQDETAIRRIEALGIDPGTVRHVVTTHLDLDHAGGLGDFPDAQVHVLGAELAAAERPPLKERARYIKAQWAHGPHWVEYGPGGDRWFGFESIRLLPNLDAEIALIPLPGHSAGHTGVAINTPDGWLLHCGDAFFHHGEIETPMSCPRGWRIFEKFNENDGEARHRNQERLRGLRQEQGAELTMICSHDPEMLEPAQTPKQAT
jgi:glyoxylase-like metal-dependent hydrolase (beta-lactamase superfamily II)